MAIQVPRPLLWLAMVVTIILAGCQPRGQQLPDESKLLAYGPDPNAIGVTNDYAPRAIGATGGYKAWINTARIKLNAVVTFYRPDNSFYLTEHQYKIYPWSNSIRILAREPTGDLTWQLSGGEFLILQNQAASTSLQQLSYADFAAAVLNITTAPARFLDTSASYTQAAEQVKKYGRWYYKIERTKGRPIRGWEKTVFYQDRKSLLVDTLWFVKSSSDKAYAVRAYDYRKAPGLNILTPSKIEIFQTSAYGTLRRRLAMIDFK